MRTCPALFDFDCNITLLPFFIVLLMNNLGFGFCFIDFSLQEHFEKRPDIIQDKQNKTDLFADIDTAVFGIMAGLSIDCHSYYNYGPFSLTESFGKGECLSVISRKCSRPSNCLLKGS